jgi:ribonuclease J
MVKIYAVGGYSEVGKNMTVVEYKDDAFIFDIGFFLPAIVSMQEREKVLDERTLRRIEAIPDDSIINSIKHKVCAQFIGHAHLDHIGAVPFMSDKYNAPIYTSNFSAEVLNLLLEDNSLSLKNPVHNIKPNTSFYVKGKKNKYKVDFINMTHSIPETLMIALHTPDGIILYGNDFKLDDTPVLGQKPNYKVLRDIAKEGVLAFVIDSLYSGSDKKTPSEKIARALLEEVMMTIQNKDSGMIVTTFSSHIARLKSIVEFGKRLNREVVLLGRSLDKYCTAAKRSNIAPFLNDIKIAKYRRQVEKMFSKVETNRKKYLVVCTGHQGEPGSILERISRRDFPFKISNNDNLIFSSSVIPTEVNIEQFAKMESRLKKFKPRIFRDAHVSGHGGREDLRDILNIVKPRNIIPSHGGFDKTEPMISLSKELGYKLNKDCHLVNDGDLLELK